MTLGSPTRIRLTELGRNTWVADLVCGQKSVLLRLAAPRRASWVAFERQALASLANCGLAVPRPLRVVTSTATGLHGPLGWPASTSLAELAVFHPVPGRELATFVASPAQLAAAGAALAWLHRAGEAVAGVRRGHLDVAWNPKLAQLGAAFAPRATGASDAEKRQQRGDAQALVARLWHRPLAATLPRGLVFGDFRPRALRFAGTARQPRAHLLDLRDVATGPWLLDVATALCHWSFVGDALRPGCARDFLRGYQRVRAFNAAERLHLAAAWRQAGAILALRTMLRHENTPHPQRPYSDYRHFLCRLAQVEACSAGAIEQLCR